VPDSKGGSFRKSEIWRSKGSTCAQSERKRECTQPPETPKEIPARQVANTGSLACPWNAPRKA